MPKKSKGGLFRKIVIGEEVRIGIHLALKKFRESAEEKELHFPSSLSSDERAYIHRLAAEHGLKSKSRGEGASRFVTIFTDDRSTIMKSDAKLSLSESSRHLATLLLNQLPVTNVERQALMPPADRGRSPYQIMEARDLTQKVCHLVNGLPRVPPTPDTWNPDLVDQRQQLPVWPLRHDILASIQHHQVTIISGETGSGKTTQVPQYLLEQCAELATPCRIVCTQPRRIAAVALAERVAMERNEKVGQTVGYQIRLESKLSEQSLLIYCTCGVLLRVLMCNDAAFWRTFTHIIVDEVHERQLFTDFLLTVLRDALNKYRHIKLIIMSATIQSQLFTKYFHNANVVHVPGRTFDVQEIFLEDFIVTSNYSTPLMTSMKKQLSKAMASSSGPKGASNAGSEAATEVESKEPNVLLNQLKNLHVSEDTADDDDRSQVSHASALPKPVPLIDEALMDTLDKAIEAAFVSNSFDAIMEHFIRGSNYVDYSHSQTGVTPLIAAAYRCHISVSEQLLVAGADHLLKASNGWTAKDFAIKSGHSEMVELLDCYENNRCVGNIQGGALDVQEVSITEDKKMILDIYHRTFNDEMVDHNLIVAMIHYIQHNFPDPSGAILVFLPGYDDIMNLRDALMSEVSGLMILPLHSLMVNMDQNKVFRPAPAGLRKVVLSTTIAQTSITVPDVVYVIDSGKHKENAYDAICNASSLKVRWISQATATQRKGRAGRCQPGYVFRLYSRQRYANLETYDTPEMMRVPLMDICLQTKILAHPPTMPIADFLARTPDPPSFVVTRNTILMLKTIEALDFWEDVTELGSHLINLSLPPQLGKMVLYSVVLKCLDPVLTIACSIAYRDPFVLPNQPGLKQQAKSIRLSMAGNSMSDYMVLLRAFQGWQKARAKGAEKMYCANNMLSPFNLEIIAGIRSQVMGQLKMSGLVRIKGNGSTHDLNKNSSNWAVVKAALTAGSYPNLSRYDREGRQLRSQMVSKLRLHPTSVLLHEAEGRYASTSSRNGLASLPTDWFIFDDMCRVGHLAMIRSVTAVSPITVVLFAGPHRLPTEAVSEFRSGLSIDLEELSDSEAEDLGDGLQAILRLDDWTVFRAEAPLIHMIFQLRQKFSSLFLRKLQSPTRPLSKSDELILDTIVKILTLEEQHLGLGGAPAIRQTPKLHSSFEAAASTSGSNWQGQGAVNPFYSGGMHLQTNPSVAVANPFCLSSTSRFFIIKATSMQALDVSLSHGLWQFGNQTEKRLNRSLKAGNSVFVIFSVQGSGHFQGYAQFTGIPSSEKLEELMSQGQGSGSGIQYRIEWVKRADLPFQATRHLVNPYNDNKRVQASRDGQEVQPLVGQALCRLWD